MHLFSKKTFAIFVSVAFSLCFSVMAAPLPSLGRFIQPDPLIANVYDSQNFSPYAYCRNNPLRLVDPTGMAFGDIPTLSTDFGSMGFGSGGYTTYTSSTTYTNSYVIGGVEYGSSYTTGTSWSSAPSYSFNFSSADILGAGMGAMGGGAAGAWNSVSGNVSNNWAGMRTGFNDTISDLKGGMGLPANQMLKYYATFASNTFKGMTESLESVKYDSLWANADYHALSPWMHGAQGALQGAGVLMSWREGNQRILSSISAGTTSGWQPYAAEGVITASLIGKAAAGTIGWGAGMWATKIPWVAAGAGSGFSIVASAWIDPMADQALKNLGV